MFQLINTQNWRHSGTDKSDEQVPVQREIMRTGRARLSDVNLGGRQDDVQTPLVPFVRLFQLCALSCRPIVPILLEKLLKLLDGNKSKWHEWHTLQPTGHRLESLRLWWVSGISCHVKAAAVSVAPNAVLIDFSQECGWFLSYKWRLSDLEISYLSMESVIISILWLL